HIHGNEGRPLGPCGDQALLALLNGLGTKLAALPPASTGPADARGKGDPAPRQKRQLDELVQHTQRILRDTERFRDATFWKPIQARSADDWRAAVKPVQSNLWDDVIGRLPS